MNVGFDWSHDFSFGNVDLNTNYYHSDSYFGLPDNNPAVAQKAYDLLNASLSWMPSQSSFRISLWGRNILDEHVANNLYQSSGGLAHTSQPPATYGATVEFKF